ncbi:hypothetical protein G4D82_14025 [Flavobacterium sp. CYK-4]|uniref:DUF5677 domain-containing protein n=1 Tax=Flavobacterium lotistagni TaxID=2709660 RepID=UPI0014083899|nr:DUF5677 domain-containing protein [Flavobacterium lotistagni]NHM08342.1 hypothetical protein [Flavobacterium lotistagni]
MEIQEVKKILNRNLQNERLDNLSSLIDKSVNFGTHILNWEIEKNNSHRENAVAQIFFKNILEIADGISILVKNSSIDNTKLLFRVLIENVLCLEYLLENDFKNRALAYIVASIHKEIKFFTKLDPNTQAGKEFRAQLNKDKIYKKVPFIKIPVIGKQIEDFELKLRSKHLSSIEAEYQRTHSKNKNPNWYSLYDGPVNLDSLAKYLNRQSLYEVYYRNCSEDIHSSNILKSNLIEKNGEITFGAMRENYTARYVVIEVLTCIIIAYSNFVDKRVPEKNQIYEKWYIDFNTKLDNTEF